MWLELGFSRLERESQKRLLVLKMDVLKSSGHHLVVHLMKSQEGGRGFKL